jgi:hypothetical protein
MWQVSTDGGHWSRWGRDGKQLYYVNMLNTMNSSKSAILFRFLPFARRLGSIAST